MWENVVEPDRPQMKIQCGAEKHSAKNMNLKLRPYLKLLKGSAEGSSWQQ